MPSTSKFFNFVHCDVFAKHTYSGNSLSVFTSSEDLNEAQMLTLTKELRHFESIFLSASNGQIRARIFDLFDELPFAGHPIIGAACTLHLKSYRQGKLNWPFHLQGGRVVNVSTEQIGERFFGTLDQGRPEMVNVIGESHHSNIASSFNLESLSNLPLEVISNGLKYLVVPVENGLENARITVSDLEQKLRSFGAEFAYLFDVNKFEGRHWNNDGIIEDVATGSAAGVVGAYAAKHGLVQLGESFTLKQGHFLGRPSEILVTPFGTAENIEKVTVSGEVVFVGEGKVVAP